jgi:glycosyltransferase involved in cell wall biosynthesis
MSLGETVGLRNRRGRVRVAAQRQMAEPSLRVLALVTDAFGEAMTSGVPVIGGNRGGSVDPLADGELGTDIDPDDEDQLVAAICTALRCSPT